MILLYFTACSIFFASIRALSDSEMLSGHSRYVLESRSYRVAVYDSMKVSTTSLIVKTASKLIVKLQKQHFTLNENIQGTRTSYSSALYFMLEPMHAHKSTKSLCNQDFTHQKGISQIPSQGTEKSRFYHHFLRLSKNIRYKKQK